LIWYWGGEWPFLAWGPRALSARHLLSPVVTRSPVRHRVTDCWSPPARLTSHPSFSSHQQQRSITPAITKVPFSFSPYRDVFLMSSRGSIFPGAVGLHSSPGTHCAGQLHLRRSLELMIRFEWSELCPPGCVFTALPYRFQLFFFLRFTLGGPSGSCCYNFLSSHFLRRFRFRSQSSLLTRLFCVPEVYRLECLNRFPLSFLVDSLPQMGI